MRSSGSSFLLLLAPALALGACSASGPGASHLADSTWQFVAIDETAPVGKMAMLSFEGDRIGANVGCNGMGGPWRVEDGRLIAGPLVQTEMYCEGKVWTQEKAVGALLAGAPTLEVTKDTLVLKSSGHSARLERTR